MPIAATITKPTATRSGGSRSPRTSLGAAPSTDPASVSTAGSFEGTIALLHWFRRLHIRWEVRDDIHEAFLTLGCAVICSRRLLNSRSGDATT
jgi:hypothetical protein